jgi:hypothetical protein
MSYALTPLILQVVLDSKLGGLTGYWALGDSTTNRLDSTGINGAITTTGTVPLVTGLRNNQAAYINNGSNNYLTIPAGLCDIGSNSKSFSIWVNFDKQGIGYQWILCQGTGNDGTNHIIYLEGNSRLYIRFLANQGWGGNAIDSGIIPSAGVWHHIAVTYSGSNAQLFYDGKLAGSVSYTGPVVASNSSFTLGRYSPYTGGVNGQAAIFYGALEEFGIWDRVLTNSEISTIYSGGRGWFYSWRTFYFRGDVDGNWSTPGNWYLDASYVTPAGTIPGSGDKVVIAGDLTTIPAVPNYLEITFDGSNLNSGLTLEGDVTFKGNAVNNGTVDSVKTSYPPALLLHMGGSNGSTSFIDSSPSNKQITPIGNTSISTSVKKIDTGSGSFSRYNYLKTTDLSGLLPKSSESITVEAWVYSTNRQGGTGIISPKYEGGGGGTPIPYTLCLNGGGGEGGGIRPTFGSYNGNWTMAVSPYDLPLNQWTHLAGVYDGSKLAIYVNGVKQGEAALASMPQYTASEFYVGNRWDGGGYYSFEGYIDEVRITKGAALYSKTFTPATAEFDNNIAGYSRYGTVNFKGTSVNNGTLNEPSIFSENSSNTGTINDEVVVKYPVLRPLGGTLGSGVTLSYQEYPTKLYFYPAHSNNWFDILNWWTDYSHTQQCNFFPRTDTTVYVLGNLNSNSGPAINVDKVIFIDSDLGSGVTVYANYTEFRGTSQNYGVLNSSTATAQANLLLNFEGANNSAVFQDSSAYSQTITSTGSPRISTAVVKSGISSGYFDGGGYLSVSNSTGNFTRSSTTEPITVEAWVYQTSMSSYACIVSWHYSGTPIPFVLGIGDGVGGNGNKPFFGSYNGSSWLSNAYDSRDLDVGSWVHLAGVYDGVNLKLFVDGKLVSSVSAPAISTYATDQVLIGTRWDGGAHFRGYIDDVRITRGVAAYSVNFTPPTTNLTGTVAAQGSTKFGDYSQNLGTVNTFSSFYEHAFNTGTLSQSEVYYPSVGNAGGSAGDITYKTTHNNARYFNAAVDNNWNTLGNWWNDPGCNVQATIIPGVSNTAYIKANVNSNTGPSAQVGLLVLSGGNISSGVSITAPAELYGKSNNAGTVVGNVKLFGYSSNTGTITGNVDVYTLSQSSPGGTISGTITYYGTGERVIYVKDPSGTGALYIDENFTTLASGQITNNTQLVLTAGSYLNNGTPQYNCRSLKILGGAWINQTQFNVVDYAYLYGGSYTYSTIQGRTIFRDTSYNSGLLQGDNLFLDSSYNQYNGTLSGNTLFADKSYNRGIGALGATITFNPGTHTNAYSGVPTINGPAIFNQAVGGVYTVTGTDYWGGGNFNGTIKGRDGVQITEWVFEDTSRVSYDGKIQGNATFKDYSGTDPYYVNITGNLTTQGHANVAYPRVNGNIICNGDSRVSGDNWGTGYCVGTGTFNGNSVNAGVTIRGNASFNGNSYNGGIVNGDAIFNGFSYNTHNILGNATLNTSYYSGTTPPTAGELTINDSRTYSGAVSGLLKDSTGSTITQFIFNNTSYLSGNITLPNLVFNNSSYISWNVTVYGDVIFNNTAYTQGNNSVTGNVVCNDSVQFSCDVQPTNPPNNTVTFNGNSINRGTINVPTTFNGLSWSTGTLNGATTVTRATGGVLTLSNGQNWQGLYGIYSDSYLYRTTRRVTLFKGGDGATITKIVYTDGATQTSGYDWDPPTLYIDAEFHGAAINYATIVGNVDFYDTSSNNAWSQSAIINGSVTFHDYSQNNAIVHISPDFNQYAASTGQISFRDYSRNNGLVGENRYGYSAITDAYFYDSGWSYGTVTGVSHYQGWANGVWTLPINLNWAGMPTSGGGIVGSDSSTVTTWVFSGTGSNSATLPGNAVFYGTGYNSGTVTGNATFNNTSRNGGPSPYWWVGGYVGTVNGNATFNDLSTNLATVLGNAYYGAAVNGVYTIPSGYQWGATGTIGGGIFDGQGNPLTTWVFNSGSYNSVTIPGNAVFNGTAYNYGTVTGNGTFNDASYNRGPDYNYFGYRHGIISKNATFNGSSYNASKVNGNATFSTTTSYVTSISNIAGTATFNYASGGYIPWPRNQNFIGTWGGLLLDGAGLQATIVFSGTSQNQATIKSPAKFTEYSINRATINSSAEFIDNSINRSIVKGNAIFRGSGYNDLYYFYNPITGNYQYSGYTGTVEGNADVYPIIPIDSPGEWNYNFPLMGNVYGSINYYGTPLFYNNTYNDGDWDNIYNWWQTGSFATQAITLPDITIDAYIYGSVTQKSGGGVAEAKKLVATARPPILDYVYNYDTNNYNYVATTYPVYIEIPITLAGEAYINGSDPVDYFDYSTYEYKTASSPSVLKSTLTTSKATFSKNAINSGTITGDADFKTNSRNSGVDGPGTVLGNAGVYYPGFAPITGTVVGSTTYYNFIAPYTLNLSNLGQEYAILAPITPLVLSVSGPSVLEINWKLNNLGQLNNGWLSYNNTTRTFTGTPTPEHANQYESLVITVLADVPNYVNYSYTQTFSGLIPAYRVNISPTQAEFLLSNPATAITPIAITSGGRPNTTYLGLSSGSSVFNYFPSYYGGSTFTGLPSGLTYNPSTRTISGSPQLPGSTPLNQNIVNSGSLIFDAYLVGSPGTTPNYKTELQFDYTFKTDLIISKIPKQILGLVGGEGGAVNIPITVTGSGTIAGITVEGLPNGLYLAGDNSSIVGSIQLTPGSQATNTFTCVVRVSDGYYTNINRSFDILTNDLIIYPEQTISFFGRTALTYNVGVSLDQTNNYVWNEPVGLPPGVTLDPDTGIISGSATAEGTGTATLSITTIGSNKTVTGIIDWTVAFIPITLVGSSFSVMRRRDTSIQILYSGDKPYLWGVTGNLPTGLSLDTATGKISGNTSAPAGAYSIIITAEDPGGAFPTSKNYVINVSAATSGLKPTLAITAYTGSTLNYQVTYTGVQPDSWTLVSGNPSPLAFNTATGLITGSVGNSPTTITFTVLATTDGVNTIQCVVTVKVIYPPPIVANQQFSGFRNSYSSFQVINTGGNVVSWYYSGSIPPGMTLSSSTGLISGTPVGIGIFTSRVFAIGQTASDYGDITIAINEILSVITPNQAFVLNAGIPVKSTTKILTTGGVPTSWTLLNPIDNSTIGVSSAGVITGLPPMETGLYYAYFRASNSSGDSDIVPVTLNVLSAPPIITQNQTQQVYAKSQISFQVQYTGGTPTVWTISSNFYGLRISELGVISGVINATGTFIYVVTAYNDGGSSSARVTIYIDKSLPVIYPGQTLRLLLGGNNSAKISYIGTDSSLFLKPMSELPAGLSLNSATGVVSGVSTKVGTSQVSVIISNSTGSTEQIVGVEVYTVISQDQTFSGAVGAQARFNIATIGTTSVTNWQLVSGRLPLGLTLSIYGSISGIPLETGTFDIVVSGLVGALTNTGNILINIYEVAPQIIANQRIYIEAGAYLTQGLKVLTAGGFPNSWTGTQITGAPDIYIDQFTGEYKGKAPTILGDYTSYVTASNGIGSSPQTAVTLTVTTPKVVITPGQTITAGAYSNFTQQLRYTGGASAVWEVVNKPVEITINNSGVVSGNITEVGSFSYLIRATTAGGSTQEYITVNIPGASPVITPGQVINLLISSPVVVSIDYSGVVDNWELVPGSELPIDVQINKSTGDLTWTPPGLIGSYTIDIFVSNNYGFTRGQVNIIIKDNPPVIGNNQTFSVITGRDLLLYVDYTGGTPTSWIATGLPAGLVIDSESGAITGRVNNPGSYIANVTATNSTGYSTTTITITALKRIPELVKNQVFILTTEKFINIPLAYTGEGSIIWGAVGLPDGFSINTESGVISGSSSITGNYTVTVTLQSVEYGTTSGVFKIFVTSNSSKLVISPNQLITATVGIPVSFTPTYIGTPVNWLAPGLPEGLTINPASGTISGAPVASGKITICLFAVDGSNISSAAFITIRTHN